jgi:hypothetical protein
MQTQTLASLISSAGPQSRTKLSRPPLSLTGNEKTVEGQLFLEQALERSGLLLLAVWCKPCVSCSQVLPPKPPAPLNQTPENRPQKAAKSLTQKISVSCQCQVIDFFFGILLAQRNYMDSRVCIIVIDSTPHEDHLREKRARLIKVCWIPFEFHRIS